MKNQINNFMENIGEKEKNTSYKQTILIFKIKTFPSKLPK